MAKRNGAIGEKQKSKSRKTAKRLAIKAEMLANKASKKRK